MSHSPKPKVGIGEPTEAISECGDSWIVNRQEIGGRLVDDMQGQGEAKRDPRFPKVLVSLKGVHCHRALNQVLFEQLLVPNLIGGREARAMI